MHSFLVFLCFALCGAFFTQTVVVPLAITNNNINNNTNLAPMPVPVTTSGSSGQSSGQLPAMWSPFYWNMTGSYSATGTIANNVIYPTPPAPLMNPTGPLYLGIDVAAQTIKMNFTVGGMQKTNSTGTWLTFAPATQCWFIPYWTYQVQIQAYTFATLKHNFGDTVGLWTGNVEDVSGCSTTIATALLTKHNRVFEWNFQGGFVTNLGSTNFDYQLLFNSFDNVVPQSNTAYWDVDASCYPPNFVSKTFCQDTWPFGCSGFLAGYKPEGSSTPCCNSALGNGTMC